ncbi:hypothetical protein J6590_015965 [Homalodisca vitripennis]|nr:hypothetical protein J6590_015965 [Homalodisca vitripennis]
MAIASVAEVLYKPEAVETSELVDTERWFTNICPHIINKLPNLMKGAATPNVRHEHFIIYRVLDIRLGDYPIRRLTSVL